MPLSAGGGAALGAIGGGLVEGGLGLVGSIMSNRANKEAMDAQNATNMAIWHEQAEYNKPINQVARLKEAGLNPALVYGNGSVANTMGPGPSMGSSKRDYDMSGFKVRDMLGKYYETKNQSLTSQQLQTAIDQNKLMMEQTAKRTELLEEERRSQARRNEFFDYMMAPLREGAGAARGLWQHGWKDMWDSFVGRNKVEMDVQPQGGSK